MAQTDDRRRRRARARRGRGRRRRDRPRPCPAARARAVITQKAPGVVFGLEAAEVTFRALDPDVDRAAGRRGPVARGRVRCCGSRAPPRDPDRRADRAQLPAAALRRRHAHRALRAGGRREPAQILDTRKTTPGLRRSRRPRWPPAADQPSGRAVRRGADQGEPCRARGRRGGGGPPGPGARARAAARGRVPDDCRGRRGAGGGAPRILLDNMDVEQLRAAVVTSPVAQSSRRAAA